MDGRLGQVHIHSGYYGGKKIRVDGLVKIMGVHRRVHRQKLVTLCAAVQWALNTALPQRLGISTFQRMLGRKPRALCAALVEEKEELESSELDGGKLR